MKVVKKVSVLSAALVCLFVMPLLPEEAGAQITGEDLFMQHCAACHPDGGNVINPKKTLHKKDREANGIVTAEDIVNKIRNPGPTPTHPQEWAGMKKFDRRTIPDEDALKIAEYVLKTFE